ncbi:hypothetical protein VCHENC02_0598B, partial [Vibrio harveyi]
PVSVRIIGMSGFCCVTRWSITAAWIPKLDETANSPSKFSNAHFTLSCAESCSSSTLI